MQASWSLQSAALQQVSAGMQAAPHRFVPAWHRFFLFLRFFFLAPAFSGGATLASRAAVGLAPRSRPRSARRRVSVGTRPVVQWSNRDAFMIFSLWYRESAIVRCGSSNLL
jgi:hypothetical protein